MNKRLQNGSAIALAFAMSACGGSSAPTYPAPSSHVASVEVSAPSSMVTIGGTLQLTDVPKDSNGNAINMLSASWSSSNLALATVSSSGLVMGLAAGSVTISATVSGVIGTTAITIAGGGFPSSANVDATPSLQFNPGQVDIAKDGTVTWRFGSVTHNVTFATGSAGTPANIGNMNNANASATFSTAGTYPYRCTIHAGMSGTVVVH